MQKNVPSIFRFSAPHPCWKRDVKNPQKELKSVRKHKRAQIQKPSPNDGPALGTF